jgi:hypothetical protein
MQEYPGVTGKVLLFGILAEMEAQIAVHQRGEVTTKGTATVVLPSRVPQGKQLYKRGRIA